MCTHTHGYKSRARNLVLVIEKASHAVILGGFRGIECGEDLLRGEGAVADQLVVAVQMHHFRLVVHGILHIVGVARRVLLFVSHVVENL